MEPARGLPLADRQRAQHGLALDFLKAGLLDRIKSGMGGIKAKFSKCKSHGSDLAALLVLMQQQL